MAVRQSGPDKDIAKLKEEIASVVASEGGKVDASRIRDKYKEHCGKKFPKNVIKGKLTSFVKEHMSDDIEVIQDGTVNFFKSKTKRKDAKTVKAPVGKTKRECVPVQHHSTTNTGENIKHTSSLMNTELPVPVHKTKSESGPARHSLASTSIISEPNTPTGPNPASFVPIQPLMLSFDAYRNDFPSLNAHSQPNAVRHQSMPCQYQLHPMQSQKTKSNHQSVNFNINSSSKAPTGPNDTNIKMEVDRIIEELSKDHYVQVDIVKKRLFEKFKVQKAKDLGNYRRVDDIPGIRELLKKMREVNAAIQAFVMVRAVSTLHELSKYLTSLYSDARDYEDLKLGPLVKHPLVYEYFKFPSNLDPPEVTTLKVMKYLRQFMKKNKLWDRKVDMAEFLEYLTKQMSCETPFELGVKIDSIGLMIKCIGRCGSAECTARREAEQSLMEEIAEEIEQQMSRFKKQLLGSNPHGGIPDPDALVNKLLGLSPVDVLHKLFEYCGDFFQGKTKKKVTKFVMMCVSDKPSRKLFQLALHKTCRDLVQPVEDFREQDNAKNTADSEKDTRQTTIPNNNLGRENGCPTQQELLSEAKRWLVGKSSRSVDFKLLARVEDSVLNHYKGFTTFRDLGQGSFLQFLSEQKELETLISSSASHSEESSLGIRKSDVVDLLQQCGVDSEKTKLHAAVRVQYKNMSTNLDETSLDALIARAREQGRQHGRTSYSVVYEACLVADTLNAVHVQGPGEGGRQKGTKHVGILGYQDKDSVLACLYQTPLLEDLIVWSEWHSVFAPIYGNLKLFIRRNSQNQKVDNDSTNPSDLVAIETSSGSLLRITRITSTDVFLKCAKRGDVVGTSGHLVSLVFQYGGVKKAPMALLASHMKEAFLSLNVVDETKSSEESSKYVVKFAIRCLSRVPSLMRHALGMKIFIEPLMFVFGNGQTPGLVLKYCETFEEKSMIHSLGIHFGVSEWQEDFKKKFEFTESCDCEEQIDAIAVADEVKVKRLENLSAQVEKESFSDEANDEPDAEEKARNQKEISEHMSTDENIKCVENDPNTSAKEQECLDVVDSIRRDEFGIGVEFLPEHRQMMENQRSREGRGLHRLSSELYSKDTHFVLELVQNADDNRYSDNLLQDSPPSIAFFVNVQKIVVFNNEVGFEERNIRALCDVGKSTKGKQRYGYIGQKGIGFKSVFRITDTPEVHSNGYHIKFDAKSGPTGYILPHWCADNAAREDSDYSEWTTRIVLPLKEEMKDAQKRTLIARFHDIQPSLLLFLRRLRKIKIHDEVSKTTREMFRRDCGDKLIEITHSNGVDLWFVVKKQLSASAMKEDIESTEIALAFPLPARRSSASTVCLEDVTAFIQAKSLIQQPVFAFLPLRSYGFRFIVQADFDVPSSREDVDKDSAWNQWLRQEIGSLFVQAFDDFKDHECFLGVASIVQLLQFVPLEDEILDFFKPLTQTILEGISRKQCIPVVSKQATHDSILNMDIKSDHSEVARESEDEIKWVFPSQVVIAEDYLIEELISDQVLNRYLNKYYLHPHLSSYLHAPLRRVLGIETISCQHLIDIGKTIASEVKVKMDTQQDTRGFFEAFARWVAKWLCGVYRCLERERDCSDETLQEIAQINIFPLSRRQCTTIFAQHIFLPLEENVMGEQAKTKASRRAAEIVHREMRSLHPLILASLDDIGRPQVRKLLERLQVRCLTSSELIKHHIMPALKEAQNKSVMQPDVIYSYIFYIKDQWDLDPGVCDLQELRSYALIETNKGFVNPSLEPVHFTVEYGNKTNLQKDFPSVPWTVIDNSYITSASSKETRISWEKFLLALGVVHFLAIERKDVSLSKSQLASSVWSSLSDYWPQTTGDGHYIIKDYGSSELEILLSAGSNDELEKLAEILDQHWDDLYSKYTKDVPYLDEQNRVLGNTYSSFFLNLKEKTWLPTRSSQLCPKPLRSCPRNVFKPTTEVVDLLGDHGIYASPSLVNEKFLDALGIRTSVKFDTLVGEFMKWIEKSLGYEDLDGGFTTSLEHMTNVYKFLESQINNNDERKKFLEDVTKNRPVVFVPNLPTRSQDTNHNILGTFLLTKHVYWSDPSNLMQNSRKEASILIYPRKLLKSYYPTLLEKFFIDFFGIDASPNLKEYISLLETIASQSTMASGPVVDNMMRVYNVIANKCLDQANATSFIKSQLLNLNVFPTMEERWVSLKEKPLFNDDKSYAKLFREAESQKKDDEASQVKRNEEKVHFVKMGLQPKHHKGKRNDAKLSKEEVENSCIRESVERFFREVCCIPNLSECVSMEIVPTLISECPALQSFLFRLIPYIQRFLYWNHPVRHEKHQDSGMANALSTVKCFSAEELEVVYHLSTHPQITVSSKKACGVQNNPMAFYVTDSELKDTKDIIKELVQFFAPPESVGSLSNFLCVLTLKSEDEVEDYMESQDLDSLPDDVTEWMVPEPQPISVPMKTEPPSESPLHPDSVMTPDYEGPPEIQETDGEPRGLKSWPPKSPGTPAVCGTTSKNPATEQVLTSWPPPAPPDAYVSPKVEVPASVVPNLFQAQTQLPSGQVTSPPIDASAPQPAVHVMQSQPNIIFSDSNSNVSANAHDHSTSNAPARVSYDDVTSQQRPQSVRPLQLSDVRVELEEVDLGTALGGSELISLTQSANAEDIGRWGEQLVYILLKNIEPENEVIWVNQCFESRSPYDIVMKREGVDVFIEVKSTSYSGKHVLEISSQEIKCAFEKQENYHLYRVYNAGNPHECRVARLRNLASNLDTKAVSLFILI